MKADTVSRPVFDKVLRQEPLSVVMFDLETTDLSGMIGRILCCSFKPLGKEPYTFRADRKPYRTNDIIDDSILAEAIRDELESYDIVVGHNSKLFDLKFLATRLFKAGLRPREPQYQVDTMWVVRSHLRTSSKLENVQKFMGLPEQKTPITWDNWSRAGAFVKSAMDEVVIHCEQDVKVLEGVYIGLSPYIKELKKG